jgi:hypothetical protein
VAADNNACARALRPSVIHRKVLGSFRADWGPRAYAVQHPGATDRRAVQSVAVHLISLYFVLERGLTPTEATDKMRHALAEKSRFIWLEPPSSMNEITVVDVVNRTDPIEHEAMVKRWARSAWEAWRAHHDQIRKWAG